MATVGVKGLILVYHGYSVKPEMLSRP